MKTWKLETLVEARYPRENMPIDIEQIQQEFDGGRATENVYAWITEQPHIEESTGLIIVNTDQGDWALPEHYLVPVIAY